MRHAFSQLRNARKQGHPWYSASLEHKCQADLQGTARCHRSTSTRGPHSTTMQHTRPGFERVSSQDIPCPHHTGYKRHPSSSAPYYSRKRSGALPRSFHPVVWSTNCSSALPRHMVGMQRHHNPVGTCPCYRTRTRSWRLEDCLHFSICACHPCAGAMLIFSASSQI